MQRLYYGGDIITMRAETDAPEALLVSDGKIAYVGELLEARKRCLPGAEEIDLGGRTLMPSFIDAHSHIAMLAQYTDFVNLGKCESFDDLVETLTAWKEEKGLGEGDILVGYSYDHNFLKEQAHPTRAVLDRVSGVTAHTLLGQTEDASRFSVAMDGDVREALFYAFAEAKLPLLELRPRMASLEEVFLDLTDEDDAVAARAAALFHTQEREEASGDDSHL